VLIGLAAIAFGQPNGVFTWGIWAGLYLVSRIFYEPGSEKAVITGKRIALAIGLITAMCAIWMALYFAPFMRDVVENTWDAFLGRMEAVFSALTFMFTPRTGIHPFLSIAVLIGVIYALRHRRYLWMVVACAFAMVLFWIDAATDGTLKHVLTGFWYTDYYRTGAMASLFAMPLAALGFASMFLALHRLFARGKRAGEKTSDGTVANAPAWTIVVPAGILVVLFGVCQFLPIGISYGDGSSINMGLIKVHKRLESDYSWDKVLTREEVEFARQATDMIPDGAIMINVPSDGSAWLYGVEGTNLFFRRSLNEGLGDEEESEEIRLHLADVTKDRDMQMVLNEYDAHYVLLLDDPSSDNPTRTDHRYEQEEWAGIESIDENTPGFTLLLSEGDMRLYRIDW